MLKFILILSSSLIFILIQYQSEIKHFFLNKKVSYKNNLKIVSTYRDGKIVEREVFHLNPYYKITCKDGYAVSFYYRRCLPLKTIEKNSKIF